jgi:ankyrin repeat protein
MTQSQTTSNGPVYQLVGALAIVLPDKSDMLVKQLFEACACGDLDNVRYVLETNQLNINITNADGLSPLAMACTCKNNMAVVQALVENGAVSSPTLVEYRMAAWNPGYVAYLLSMGLTCDNRNTYGSIGHILCQELADPLCRRDPVMADRVACINLNLIAGYTTIDPHIVDARGNTLLHYTATSGLTQATQGLLRGKANPNIINDNDDTPLLASMKVCQQKVKNNQNDVVAHRSEYIKLAQMLWQAMPQIIRKNAHHISVIQSVSQTVPEFATFLK